MLQRGVGENEHARHELPASLSRHRFAFDDRRRSGGRQFDRNAGPSIVGARRTPDMPAVQFDDLPAHVQADSRTARMPAIVELLVFEAEELVEDAGPKGGGHARSGVGHTDRDGADPLGSPSAR